MKDGAPKKAAAPKKDAAAKKAGKAPSVSVEHSRNHVLARTGLSGKGQTKTIAIQSADEEGALKKARLWLKKACAENGIDY